MILWVLGMSHHFVVSILLFLRKGATIVVANRGFPFSVLEAAQKGGINFIYASPVHYYLLAVSDAVSAGSLAKVRLAISTAMKMPAEIFEMFYRKFGIAPAEAYGIIEIGLPFINTEFGVGGRQTVGKILPDYQLRIDHPDEHGIGEVLIKGRGMFDAYFSPWRMRDECLRDGWFDTGDLGRIDEQGQAEPAGAQQNRDRLRGHESVSGRGGRGDQFDAGDQGIPGLRAGASAVWSDGGRARGVGRGGGR